MRVWCQQTGNCTVDGADFFTGELWRGQTAMIPIRQFSDELSDKHDFGVGYQHFGTPPTPFPDPTRAIVSIDGELGTLLPSEQRTGAVFSWTPYPADPQLLELRFEDGGSDKPVDVYAGFSDELCEKANPRPDCGE